MNGQGKATRWVAGIGNLLILLLFADIGQAKKQVDYQKGVLVQMESAQCGYAEKEGKTFAGQILGTDGQHKKTQEVLCPEYILQTDRIIYRIRPKDDKHPALLPVGETALFRIDKDKMRLKVPEGDDKERKYHVLSMMPRPEATKAAKNNRE